MSNRPKVAEVLELAERRIATWLERAAYERGTVADMAKHSLIRRGAEGRAEAYEQAAKELALALGIST